MLKDKKFEEITDESMLEGVTGGAASVDRDLEITLSCPSCGKTFTGLRNIAQKMLDSHKANCKG